jgi:hypothetical protein
LSSTPYGLAVAVIGKKGKTKNVTHAVWSALACQRAKILRKLKNVTHAIWSGCGCHWQKKEKTKHVTHAVWSGCDSHWAK